MYALTVDELFAVFRRGLRNGNWRKLKASERALFKAALLYLRRGGRIVSVSVLEKLHFLIEKLNETIRMRIFRKGFERAIEILNACENLAWYLFKEMAKRTRLYILARNNMRGKLYSCANMCQKSE